MEVKIAYVEELEASLLQLATAAPPAAPAVGAAGQGEGAEEVEAAGVVDWGLLVSQDLAVMRCELFFF